MPEIFNVDALADALAERLGNSFRQVVNEEIKAAGESVLQEKLLSPKEACNLFTPAITIPTLNKIVKQGKLSKYNLGGQKVFYKYSEVLSALKSYKRYEQQFRESN